MNSRLRELNILKFIQDQFISLHAGPGLSLFIGYLILAISVVVLCWLAHYIAKRYVANFINLLISKAHSPWSVAITKFNLIRRIAYLAPTLVLYLTAPLFGTTKLAFSLSIVSAVILIANLYLTIVIGLIIDSLLKSFEGIYDTYEYSHKRPIKSYIQVGRMVVFILVSIFFIAILFDKSPWSFLTGLGAATAVLLLVFRDVILGFVASIHLSTYDMIRLGDWIELPSYNADGEVIEISLTTVKVRNWDNTITTIPTYTFISTGVKNWRGMRESGGRRIKRSINVDMKSVKFCSPDLLETLKKIDCLKLYFANKLRELEESNRGVQTTDKDMPLNFRILTNLGTFRAYVSEYLKANRHIHMSSFTFMVRQLQPTESGIPLEIYAFCNETDSVKYEAVQSDIFDHILAAMPTFELHPYQKMSSYSLSSLTEALGKHN
ncbi:MAG: mechanosensitive ion channel family protein [Deltaproteobacteria bacterium]|nr:mechanosensitive ion channel family protein [Deltaproteobacteria bacterium]